VSAPIRSAFPAKAVFASVALNVLAAVSFLNGTLAFVAVFCCESFKNVAFEVRKFQVFQKR